MKKIIISLIGLILILSLASCDSASNNPTPTKTQDVPNALITIVDVENLSLDQAIRKLSECGVSNITSNKNNYEGWPPEKLIVVSQSIAAGKKNIRQHRSRTIL